MGAGTDAHHLRPTDISINSARNNRDFDNGGSLYIDGGGACQRGYSKNVILYGSKI